MADAQTIDENLLEEIESITNKEPEKKESEKLEVTADELESLRHSLEEKTRESQEWKFKAEDATRRTSEVSSRLSNETANRLTAEEVAIQNGIAAATADAERLENEIVTAQESGKFHDAAKLTRQLASAQTKIDGWESRKSQFEAVKNQPRQVAQQPVEYPRSQAWIARHPEYNTNPSFKNKVAAAHFDAISNGIEMESDEYFSHIDDFISPKKTTTTAPRNKVAATPPSRGTTSMSGNNTQGSNRLTPDEAEVAVMTYPKLSAAEAQKKYCDNRQILFKMGKLSGSAA